LALACGASAEAAAQKAGLSRRTVCRRLADPAFRAKVAAARAELARQTSGVLTAAGMSAAKTLVVLQEAANSEAVRLGAARSTLDLGRKLREAVDWGDRLAALEGRLESLLGGAQRRAAGAASTGADGVPPPAPEVPR
jgi:hypothetical protein